ncbi:hypothetical protein VW35_05020 [Devosia soli]|uniref:Uncharacterized protein n=1 Tax=Devosia soli TaxID=361041 RepID=A0A0F5LCD4_9HYPH|nr:hypothetical protein [Devosia soli]KKB79854.1 hypothetical protein VW35_05020 [Devosia soli]
MIRFAALAALALAGCSAPAFAEDAQCFQNETALVIAQTRTDEAGTDILVRAPAKGKIKCEYEEREGDWIIGSPGDPLWYEALAGKFLVLTRSTGPDGDIVIYDLAIREKLVDEPADDEIVVTEDAVTYWQRIASGTADNCDRFAEYSEMGLGAVVAEERVLDLASGTIKQTGQSRCSSTQ